MIGRILSPEDLLRVYRRHWTSCSGLDLKELDLSTAILYFEDKANLEHVFRNTPWCFENGMLVFQQMKLGISLFSLQFSFTPIWIQLHDTHVNWRYVPNVNLIAEKIGNVLEIDRFSLESGYAKAARVSVEYLLSKSLLPSVWIDNFSETDD